MYGLKRCLHHNHYSKGRVCKYFLKLRNVVITLRQPYLFCPFMKLALSCVLLANYLSVSKDKNVSFHLAILSKMEEVLSIF